MMTTPDCPDNTAQREAVSRSKRALLKAGWVAPVVVVLSLPVVSFAANASGRVNPPPCGRTGSPTGTPACK
jgi:hypothetical protein